MFYFVRAIVEEKMPVLIMCKSNDDRKGVMRRTRPQLVAEGLVAIIAGYVSLDPLQPWLTLIGSYDTTSTTLSNLWYYFLLHPAQYKRLQREIDAVFLRGEDPVDQERLVGMEFLNACINESLRLAPPVPSGSQRGIPPTADGKLVGSQSVSEVTPDSPY